MAKSLAKSTHGGKRKGAGRKPALLPVFHKKFRASELERIRFNVYMTGDARKDFLLVLNALDHSAIGRFVKKLHEQ